MEETKICPKCNSSMKKGILVGYNQGAFGGLIWGSKMKTILSLPNGVEGETPTCAYMCEGCGFVEVYKEIKK